MPWWDICGTVPTMAYQHGAIDLNMTDLIYTITFTTPFSSPPEIIIPVVQNTSGDPSVMDIRATVINTPTGSSCQVILSSIPDTNNYDLVWIAGSLTAVFEAISQGQKISEAPPVDGALADADKLVVLRYGPYIRTQLIDWGDMRTYFPNAASIPAAPTTAGEAGQVALPSGGSPWLFAHNGTQWVRIPVDASSAWTGQNVLTKFREGVTALSNGQQAHAISFSPAFDIGDVPNGTYLAIKCQIENVADNPVSLLHGMVTAKSRTGFTFTTNAPTDSANFKLVWDARLRTDL